MNLRRLKKIKARGKKRETERIQGTERVQHVHKQWLSVKLVVYKIFAEVLVDSSTILYVYPHKLTKQLSDFLKEKKNHWNTKETSIHLDY